MKAEDIQQILDELKDRNAYGVIDNACKLVMERTKLEFQIIHINIALKKIQEFARTNMPDPITPKSEEEEE